MLFILTIVCSALVSSVLSFAPTSNRFSGVGKSKLCAVTAEPTKKVVPGGEFIDVDAELAKSTFPIKPDALVELAKEVLMKGAGVDDPSLLASNFEFCAPVVGPLQKDEYINSLKNFDLLQAFPDMNNRFYNIHVDPFEPNRVWWFTRAKATHTGPLLGKPATNKKI